MSTVKEETALKPVTMKLSQSTIDKVANIKRVTGETNRTRIMAVGVKLLEHLIQETEKGSKVVIKRGDGSEESINFIGI